MGERLRVGVVFGGPSPEHDVSRASAAGVVRALPRDLFEPVVVGISRSGRMMLIPAETVSRLGASGALAAEGTDVILAGDGGAGARVLSAEPPHERLASVDVVFPVMHGPFGEDGVFQGFLETLGVPYVGCGVQASATSMDKVSMKRAFLEAGLPVTPYVWFTGRQWQAADDGKQLVDGLQWPLFVKPARLGSSIGVSRVTAPAELTWAVEGALTYDDVVVVEQGVAAREIVAGVLGGLNPEVSVPAEIGVPGDWLDYQQKYLATQDSVTIPASLPPHVTRQVRDMSLRAFSAVGGWGLARVDFLYEEAQQRLYVLEINTMPGFTPRSVYARAWDHSGVSYPDLLARLVQLARTRHRHSAQRAAGMLA
ncbi:MAG TPA: D-alanine--D-alanine ligase family protein [Streptosporangiaceae bacterium]|nr:D-alanine--D-alanine ligase family protein [Streptosporangiaceae bacterium]